MKIIRQILIPILILMTTGALLVSTRDGLSENMVRWHACANWGWNERPQSDILFIGTSRSFRSVNLTQLKYGLETKGHKVGNIEMIWTDFPNTLVKVWATEDYLSTGAKPKIVIFENSMSEKPRDFRERQNAPNLVMLPVSQRYMPQSLYHHLQNYLNAEFETSWSRIFKADYTSSTQFKVNQWRVMLYDFFDSPKHTRMSRKDYCPDENKTWDTSVIIDRKDFGSDTVNDADHQKFIENVSKYIPYSPKSDFRKYEVAMMSYLMERVEGINPEKTYLWFPGNYSVTYERGFEADFKAIFPSVDKILGAEIAETLKPYDRQTIFYNENHLNHEGRKHVTNLWIDLLDQDLSDLDMAK